MNEITRERKDLLLLALVDTFGIGTWFEVVGDATAMACTRGRRKTVPATYREVRKLSRESKLLRKKRENMPALFCVTSAGYAESIRIRQRRPCVTAQDAAQRIPTKENKHERQQNPSPDAGEGAGEAEGRSRDTQAREEAGERRSV